MRYGVADRLRNTNAVTYQKVFDLDDTSRNFFAFKIADLIYPKVGRHMARMRGKILTDLRRQFRHFLVRR